MSFQVELQNSCSLLNIIAGCSRLPDMFFLISFSLDQNLKCFVIRLAWYIIHNARKSNDRNYINPGENHDSLKDEIYVCLYLKVDLICQWIFTFTSLNPLFNVSQMHLPSLYLWQSIRERFKSTNRILSKNSNFAC